MLKCVKPFARPYDVKLERELTEDERLKENNWNPWSRKLVRIDKTISSPLDAALFLAADKHENRLDRFVWRFLHENPEYDAWVRLMPEIVPDGLYEYQNNYSNTDLIAVDRLVNECGVIPPDGQFLFHGGLWPSDEGKLKLTRIVTERVLSTSLCPKVALENGDWMGKSWDAGRLDLIVIQVKSPVTRAFIFNKDSDGNRHELEVLFASGAKLKFIDETLACTDWKVNKANCNTKTIKTYVINAELN